MKHKILIAGSRTFSDYDRLKKEVDSLIGYGLKNLIYPDIENEIVSGGARGADALAEKYALERNFQFTLFKADWNNLGRSAGPIRNNQMADYVDYGIVFWDSESTGTKHMISAMKVRSKPIKICLF